MRRVVAIASLAALAISAHANLITNGSFELGDSNIGAFKTVNAGNSTSITGWTVTSGSVDYIGTYWAASDGVRSLDLAGNADGMISQSVFLTGGQSYYMTFDLSGNPDGPPDPKIADVVVDGVLHQFTVSNPVDRFHMNWRHFSLTFTAASTGFKTISFGTSEHGNFSDFYGPALDNVRLEAVPEPFTMSLLGAAALAGFAKMRRRRLS